VLIIVGRGPPYVTENDYVAAGTIGDVLHVEGHFSNEQSTRFNVGWRDDPRESPGGGMTGAGFHVLDAFVNIAGPIAAVDARIFSQKPSPDPRDAAAAALVQFESGSTGLLATVRAAPLFWRLHVFGSKGWAEARDKTTLTVARIGEKPDTQTFPQVDSLAVLLEAFAESVETGVPFAVSTVEMLDVAGALEAIVRSMAEGGSVSLRRT
jgi:predicted dehydrogenase